MASRRRTGATALLIVLFLGGVATLLAPFWIPPPATLLLVLSDSAFGTSLEGVQAQVLDLRTGTPVSGQVGVEGLDYAILIPRMQSGEVDLEVQVEGFELASVSAMLVPLAVNRVPIELVPTFGLLEVAPVDATTSSILSSAQIELDPSEEVEPFVVLNAEPMRIPLEPGTYQARGSALGFCEAERSASVRASEVTRLNLPLSPEVGSRERARFILDWGNDPEDLDAHVLVSQTSEAMRQEHLFFRQLEVHSRSNKLVATLDVDWRRSEWFETVTILNELDKGVFQYFVHLYAGRGSLGDSDGLVEIVTDGCSSRKTYRAPPGCSERFWYVADLVTEGSETNVVDRGECRAEIPRQWKSQKDDS